MPTKKKNPSKKSAKKSASKSAPKGEVKRKRGAPLGNTNRLGKKKGTGKAITRKPTKPQDILVVPETLPGSATDTVLNSLEQAEERAKDDFALKMDAIQKSREAYMAALGSGGGTHSPTVTKVKVTSKGNPDLRTIAGREFMKAHPEFHGRAD